MIYLWKESEERSMTVKKTQCCPCQYLCSVYPVSVMLYSQYESDSTCLKKEDCLRRSGVKF